MSAIDAKKNLLALEEAKRLADPDWSRIPSRVLPPIRASLAVSEEKRNKAQLAMQQAQKNIEQMRLQHTYWRVGRRQGKFRHYGRVLFRRHGGSGLS